MNKEERKAIKDMNRFANGIDMSCVTARQMQIILNLLEKLKIKNNAIKRESEAYAEQMIRLDREKQDYFEKYRYHLQQNESLTKEFSNVIPVQKVKDKIRHYQELQDNYIKKYDEINEGLQAMINVLQELIEEREEK